MLILAPEFFQPLRDLGTYYHAKAQAIGAAETLETFLNTEADTAPVERSAFSSSDDITLKATDLEILSPEGHRLAGPLSFTLSPGKKSLL